MKYISDGTWFAKGTECELLFYCEEGPDGWGLYRGMKDGQIDEELCSNDEFEIIDDK